MMERFVRIAKFRMGQPQITEGLSEEIIHRAGLANRGEGRNNESPDALEPVGGPHS